LLKIRVKATKAAHGR